MASRTRTGRAIVLATTLGLVIPTLGASSSLVAAGPSRLASRAPVTLELWNPETNPDSVAGLQQVISSFEKTHPNITVHVDNVAWTDIYTKWLSAIQTGNVPDISLSGTTFGVTLNNLGALAPLDDLKASLGPNFFCTCAKALVNMNTANGHLYAMPFVQNSVVLWYRKDLLQQAGLGVPKTWAQLLHAAQVMTHNGIYGILATSSKDFVTEQSFYSLMLSAGADVVDRQTGKKLLFNSPQTVAALKLYAQLTKYSPPGASSYGRPESQAAMQTGKIAMFIYGSWIGGPLREANPALFKNFGAAPIPSPDGHLSGGFMGNLDILVFKKSKHVAEAKEFLKYWMQPDNYARWVTGDPASYGPVTSGVWNSPIWKNSDKVKAFAQLIDTYRRILPTAWVYGLPNPNAGTMEGLFTPAEAVQSVVLQGVDPSVAVKQTAVKLQQVLHTTS